jgi:hypothetical protein
MSILHRGASVGINDSVSPLMDGGGSVEVEELYIWSERKACAITNSICCPPANRSRYPKKALTEPPVSREASQHPSDSSRQNNHTTRKRTKLNSSKELGHKIALSPLPTEPAS